MSARFQSGSRAYWRNRDHDEPVTIRALAGERDEERWYSIEGSSTGIPESELVTKLDIEDEKLRYAEPGEMDADSDIRPEQVDPLFLQHLKILYRGGRYAYYWTPNGAGGAKISYWYEASPVHDVPDELFQPGVNAYYSVNTSGVKGNQHTRSRVEDIDAVNCLYAEFDTGRDEAKKQVALEMLSIVPCSPSVVIDSGGGLHAYWYADEPWPLVDDSQRQRCIDVQTAWVRHLPDADQSVHDLARVLRVPGTVNYKPEYAPDFPTVQIVEWHPDRAYMWDDLRAEIEDILNAPTPQTTTTPPPPSANLDDSALLLKAAANPQFAALFAGDMSDYGGDHSRADQALCNMLAFWTGKDPERMDCLFRMSGLYRQKWERQDYRDRTILKAIADTQNVYSPLGSPAFQAAQAAVAGMLDDQPDILSGLPFIQTNHRQTREITAEAIAAIVAYQQANPSAPLLYVRDATLSRVIRCEVKHNAAGKPLEDSHKIVAVGPSNLGYVMGRVANWQQLNITKKGNRYVETQVPKALILDILGALEWPEFPALVGLSYCPMFTENGTLHQEQGYNDNTCVYYADAVPLGDITPTPANVQRAKDLIDEMLCDFPFADEASRAHAYALLLLPFVRDLIDGPTPLHAIDAPTAGTGKGLLAEALAYVGRGHELASAPAGKDDAEWAKSITSWLREGRTHVNIDNIAAPLDSAALANALTQRRWGGRLLGYNQTVSLPVRQVWIATGNNLIFSEEIARRVAYIRLDANMEQPDQRSGFLHPNLLAWVHENRPALVTACCTLIANWFDQGKPLFTDRVKGSYESWAQIMGGILHSFGCDDLLGNMASVRITASTESDTLRNFVEAWAERWDTTPVGAALLITVASYDDDPNGWQGENLLAEICTALREAGRRVQMGKYIARNRGKVVQVTIKGQQRAYKIETPHNSRAGMVYRLRQVS